MKLFGYQQTNSSLGKRDMKDNIFSIKKRQQAIPMISHVLKNNTNPSRYGLNSFYLEKSVIRKKIVNAKKELLLQLKTCFGFK